MQAMRGFGHRASLLFVVVVVVGRAPNRTQGKLQKRIGGNDINVGCHEQNSKSQVMSLTQINVNVK